jgi:hypothetical protein
MVQRNIRLLVVQLAILAASCDSKVSSQLDASGQPRDSALQDRGLDGPTIDSADNTAPCAVENGVGQKQRRNGSWGPCTVLSCDKGFRKEGQTCYCPTGDCAANVEPRYGHQINPDGKDYVDPEYDSTLDKLVFKARSSDIWVGDLNPSTGELVSKDGYDYHVDSNITPLVKTSNGPEIGRDVNGWAIYYNKPHGNKGMPNIWRAVPDDLKAPTRFQLSPMTATELPNTRGAVATTLSSLPSTLILFNRDKDGKGHEGGLYYVDASKPTQETHVGPYNLFGPRWVRDGSDAIYLVDNQVWLFRPSTGEKKQLTNDGGIKDRVYGWYAPEYNGELLVLARVDETKLYIYRDEGGTYWRHIQTIMAPSEWKISNLNSPEPFVAKGKSYVVMTVRMAAGQSEITKVFVSSIRNDVRLDCTDKDGLPSSARGTAYRSEPEVFVGSEQVFIYYNVVRKDLPQGHYYIHACPTQIKTR